MPEEHNHGGPPVATSPHASAVASSAPSDLYARILGAAWGELPGAVRSAHRAGGEKRGRFRVTNGKGRGARWLVRRSRLPGEGDNIAVTLRIVAEGTGERWERRFDDGSSFITTQRMYARGVLGERFNHWELLFSVRVQNSALVYEQRGARLCFGPLRVPVPLAGAPRVRAKEESEGSGRVRVSVTVTAPFAGPLIAYDGHLEVEDTES